MSEVYGAVSIDMMAGSTTAAICGKTILLLVGARMGTGGAPMEIVTFCEEGASGGGGKAPPLILICVGAGAT